MMGGVGGGADCYCCVFFCGCRFSTALWNCAVFLVPARTFPRNCIWQHAVFLILFLLAQALFLSVFFECPSGGLVYVCIEGERGARVLVASF